MKKGKFGINLCVYTTLAFLLAYFGNTTVLILLAGAVIFLEKDEWTGKQIIQAVCLCFVQNIVNVFLGILSPIARIPYLGTVWSLMDSLIDSLVGLLVLVFCVVGILNTLKGRDANIIGAKKFADWAYGAAGVSEEEK